KPNEFYYAPALVGMTPREAEIGSPITRTLLPGGRWFKDGETDVCLLPRDVLLSDEQRKAERPVDEKAATEAPAATDAPTGPPLGLTFENAVGSKVQVGGKTFTVIGVFDDRKWYGRQGENNLRDIDDEEFTPVDYSSDSTRQNQQSNSNAAAQGDEVQVQQYEHMPANALLVIPYETALNMGATTRSFAVGIENAEQAQQELSDLMSRAALGIFGATPDRENGNKLTAKLYSSVEATSYDGFASLAIPILIAALIIANTMLGSVYERTREIGIYSSIGLAPIHVAALFIAEAIVYAVLGSISGYLIAQITAKTITSLKLLEGITLNYSSSSAVLATLIVMSTVLLSTLYPAYAASRLSNPDSRQSELGEPVGDLWRLQFPFTVSGLQSLGMAQFLADFFEQHTDTSVGKFYTDKVNFGALTLADAVELLNEGVVDLTPEELAAAAAPKRKFPLAKMPKTSEAAPLSPTDGGAPLPTPKGGRIELESIAADPQTEVYRLSMRTWLAPFDMGVSQDTDIILLPSKEEGLYELQLRLERKSGEIAAWKRVNKEFMTELRKQLLVWRTVKPASQQEYILRGRAHVRGQRVPTEEPGAVVV
ncbi:ABC transporter permease, partial [bacterium]